MGSRSLRIFAGIVLAVSAGLGQGNITTVAGNSKCCDSSDGLQAVNAWLPSATGIAVDRQGNLYIFEGGSSRIRKVTPAGIISTVAGNGNLGYTGDGGPATAASFMGSPNYPGIAIDAAGNLFISDSGNQVIRKVNTSGIITTVAGNGSPGFSGDGGPATSAQLNNPGGVAVDSAGNLYIADASNSRVRKVNPAGIISTYAGNGNVKYSGDGVQAPTTAVDRPEAVAVDSLGNVYVSETSSSRVRKVDPSGIITTVAGVAAGTNGFTGDGGPATSATLFGPVGLVVDASGNLYIADNSNARIRKVDAAGTITTYAGTGSGTASTPIGDGGPATKAFIGVVKDLALDSTGNLYLSGSAGGVVRVRRIAPGAGLSANPTSLSFAYTIGGAAPAAQTVSITATGSAMSFTASASSTSGNNWLSVTPGSGTTAASISVSVNPAGLPGGVYQGAITLTPAGAGNAPLNFGVTLTVSGAGAPAFNASSVLNALGYQSKLAPDTVFVIFGSGMGPSALAAAAGPDYPTSVGGTSVTFTPAAGGSPINAKMLYASAGQLAGLLPSSIAPGNYAVRVTYNTLSSAPQNVTVVARSFGIATANSAGSGTAQATIGNVNGGLSLTRFTTGSVAFNGFNWTLTPAHPGDTLVLWGTGGGADSANDNGGTSGDQTQAGNFSVIVSGRSITPLYAGASSGYPGLWQINFTLPADIAPDCFASVQVSAGGELSNAVSLPIAPGGQAYCSDPQLTQSALSQLDGGGAIAGGGFAMAKVAVTNTIIPTPGAAPNVTNISQETISGGIALYTAAEYAAIYGGLKIGPCNVIDRTASATAKPPQTPESYLDLGARLPFAGPGLAASVALTQATAIPGVYGYTPQNGTFTGGKYTLSGSGGKDAAAFTASVNFPSSFTIANWDTLNSIDRSKPLTLNWTSSGADSIYIIGSSSAVVGKDASNANIVHNTIFTCQVPAAPGTFTIPAGVLSYLLPSSLDAASLSKGASNLAVETVTFQPFTLNLTSGGPVAWAAFSSTLAYSRNLAVQ
jgi:uncharacterized protein (TIGR03437 family)